MIEKSNNNKKQQRRQQQDGKIYNSLILSLFVISLVYTCITLAGKIWLKKIDD